MTTFLSVDAVLAIHAEVIHETGGSPGLRDAGLLDSAVNRPQATFGGQALYPDLPCQAAALLESLGRNHPFVDGNKRIALTATDVFLRANRFRIVGTDDEKYDFVIAVVTGQLRFDAIAEWIASHMGALE